MQNRIRARVGQSKYLSLLSYVEPGEVRPLQGDDNHCGEEQHDSDLSSDFSKISDSADRVSGRQPRPVR